MLEMLILPCKDLFRNGPLTLPYREKVFLLQLEGGAQYRLARERERLHTRSSVLGIVLGDDSITDRLLSPRGTIQSSFFPED